MTTPEIQEKLKIILKPYIQNADAFENINEQTDFLKDLKINSAHLIDIVLDVEEHFDIEISDDAMEKMLSIKDAIEIIQERLA
jgi:acyl carrier protein